MILIKKNTYNLKSITSKHLKQKQKREICALKDSHWKFGISSQISWWKKNIKNNDCHNLLYIKSQLVGYTLLRERTCMIKKIKKKYFFFDTLIIHKKFRGKKLSNLLMKFNNATIKKKRFFSFLICNKKLVNFYKKNKWKKLNTSNINIIDYSTKKNGMIYNNSSKNKYFFYINT